MMDEITAFAGANAKVKIYSGTQPAGGATPSGTLLGTLTCAAVLAPAASGGQLIFDSITSDTQSDATGTASFWRLTTSADVWIADGDITQAGSGGGGDMELDTIAIVLNGTISITSWVMTAPNAP